MMNEIYKKAMDVAAVERFVGISMLQRRLSIGYTTATQVIDCMVEAGVLGERSESSSLRPAPAHFERKQCLSLIEKLLEVANS